MSLQDETVFLTVGVPDGRDVDFDPFVADDALHSIEKRLFLDARNAERPKHDVVFDERQVVPFEQGDHPRGIR